MSIIAASRALAKPASTATASMSFIVARAAPNLHAMIAPMPHPLPKSKTVLPDSSKLRESSKCLATPYEPGQQKAQYGLSGKTSVALERDAVHNSSLVVIKYIGYMFNGGTATKLVCAAILVAIIFDTGWIRLQA